ncbi:MAG: nucleoside monophosphate kinase [Candidatus Andersenbacteria bacterium]
MASRKQQTNKPLVPSDVLNVNLLGPFGAGKGTQAQMLVNQFGLHHFVAGDILKEQIRRKTTLGKKVEKTVRAGGLVSDTVVGQLFKNFLKELPHNRGLVIDGSPRNLSQKKLLDALLLKAGRRPINIVIDIPEKESLRRLSERKICVGCKHKPLGKDLHAAACLKCGGKLVRRFDDQPEIIKKRLAVYKKEVQPVIDAYAKEGRLHRVDGMGPRASVSQQIMGALAALGHSPQ